EPEKPQPRPKVAKIEAPPPPPKVAPPPKIAPPPRVVGLSLESTVEGGGGPSFAVGNTRTGDTEKKAVAPSEVPPVPGPATRGPVAPPPESKGNQVASRIPVAGVRYELPKRKHERKPPYPETPKSQGLEGDVTVLVKIDAEGH